MTQNDDLEKHLAPGRPSPSIPKVISPLPSPRSFLPLYKVTPAPPQANGQTEHTPIQIIHDSIFDMLHGTKLEIVEVGNVGADFVKSTRLQEESYR